jgi:hypothetical protein
MQVYMAIKIQVVFWVVTPCGDVLGYHRFVVPCCTLLQVGFTLKINIKMSQHRRTRLGQQEISPIQNTEFGPLVENSTCI